jgi:hypothetical protein
MRTLSATSKVLVGVAFLMIVVVCPSAWAQGTVTPRDPERPALFGILGITRGQTARINLTNIGLTAPPEPDTPKPVVALPSPCRVMMTFVDSDGNVLRNNAGQPIVRVVILQQGQSASLQINADAFITRDQLRFNVRPVVVVASTDPASVPPPCVPVLEVIDNLTARTSLVYGGSPSADRQH